MITIEVLKDFVNPKTEIREKENQWCETYKYKAKLYRFTLSQQKEAVRTALLVLEKQDEKNDLISEQALEIKRLKDLYAKLEKDYLKLKKGELQ